jgi:UDP-N-acetylglucosamine 2-epimerase (non-hydrolysing)
MKLILVCGARPNFMKIAPLLRAIKKHNNLNPILVHTGQHYDYEMSQVFFQDLELPTPDVYLGVGSGTHAEQTARVMIEFEKVLLKERPDLVIVVGDVNSTLAAALAAAKLNIPVAHVEAGLRSYDKTMPEEINRLLTDHVSDYLFTTSKYDDINLKKEGIPAKLIFRVGNVMVDSLLYNKPLAEKSDILQRLNQRKQNYALLTLHRPSNVDNEKMLKKILEAIYEISKGITVVFSVHPRTRKRLQEFNFSPQSESNLLMIPPLGYLDFLNMEINSSFIITDSGGIQVESTALGIPCLTVLDSPVWTITHEVGTNILVGSNSQKLIKEAFKILDGKGKSGKCPEIWDGRTAVRIIRILEKLNETAN